MKFEDKPRSSQRWHMVVVSCNRPYTPLAKEDSWHATLKNIGVPSEVLAKQKDLRTKANDATEIDPSHVATYADWEDLVVKYQMRRVS